MEKDKRKDIFKQIYSKDIIKRFTLLCLGLFIVSFSFNLFCLPNNLVSGGVSSLSIVVEKEIGITPSVFVLYANIFLLCISYLFLGRSKTFHSAVGALLFPLFIELTSHITQYIQIEHKPLLLITLFAGVLIGSGNGIVYKVGYTTGGSDIINQMLSKYFKIGMGKAVLITDGVVIGICSLVFSLNEILYGFILIYIISYMVDKIIIGISSSKTFYIVTKQPKEVKDYIIRDLNHSVTNFFSTGGYKEKEQVVLMTVLPTREYYQFKKGILKIDKNAFFLVTDAYEVVGGE